MRQDDSLQQALETCLAAALQVPGMDAGGVYLVDAETGDLHLACSHGLSPGFAEAMAHVPRDSGRGARVHRRETLHADTQALLAVPGRQEYDEGLRSLASIPVRYGDEVLAAMNVASRQLDAIPPETRGLLERLASMVGVALHRSRAEQALRDSEARYRALVESAPDAIFVVDTEGTIRSLNPAAAQMLGLSPEGGVGRTLAEVFPEALAGHRLGFIRQVHETGARRESDYEEEIRGVGRRWFHAIFSPLPGDAGEPGRVMGIARDVTDRVAAEQSHRQSEARYRALVDSVPDLIAELSPEGVFLSANHALLTWLGLGPEAVVGRTLWDIFPREAADRRLAHVRTAMREGGPVIERTQAAAPGHEGAWVDAVYAPVMDEAGEPTHAVAVARDVTELAETERALRRSEERYELATEAGRVGVWDWDVVNDVFYLDDTTRRMLGYGPDELPNDRRAMPRLTHPADRPAIRRAVDEVLAGRSEGFAVEHRVRRRNGTYGWFLARGRAVRDADGRLVRLIGTSADISEQKADEEQQRQVEARLQQAEKLQSLAILAGGIAHDFNNLLTGVVGNVSLARRQLPADSGIESHLSQIETAAVCAADLAGHMLAYSGHGRVVVRSVDLAEVVHEMSQLARAGLSPLIAVRQECHGELPAVRGDPTQLRQLVLNLITNAADAIGGDEGLIALRTQVVEVDRERLARTYVDDGLAGGRYVSLEVTDTGGGMSPRTVARIFDPFFTTKATGRGLGLSSVLGVVRGHRGAIEVRSQPAEGTTFEVFLPVATPAEASPAASATEGPAVACLGAVLLAEDEAIVRVVAQGGLEQVGFTTLVATDGGQAVQALEARGDDLVGVVLDVTMPVVSGTEIYRLIRRRWLEMPVLITSGFAEQEIEPLVRSGDPTAFVRKPYRPEQLVGRLQELIAVKGAPR